MKFSENSAQVRDFRDKGIIADPSFLEEVRIELNLEEGLIGLKWREGGIAEAGDSKAVLTSLCLQGTTDEQRNYLFMCWGF